MVKDTLISYLAVVKTMMQVYCQEMNLKYHTKMNGLQKVLLSKSLEVLDMLFR